MSRYMRQGIQFGGKDALVCVSPPKPVAGETKTGVHINWRVYRESGISARDSRTRHRCPRDGEGGVDWERTIDQAVYGEIEVVDAQGFRVSHAVVTQGW